MNKGSDAPFIFCYSAEKNTIWLFDSMKKYILITGCSSGIGYHLASRLRDEGYEVLATARKSESVEELIKDGFNAHTLDLTSESSIEEAVEWAKHESDNQIYGLINNGAYGQPGALEDLPTHALKTQFETNLFGWHHLIRLVLPIMLEANQGRIIQVSSILGLVAMKYRGAYNASKFALEGYTDTLRLELADTPIRVSLIEPGPVKSHFRQNALAKFQENIDIEQSRHSAIYKLTLARLSNPTPKNPFTLEPESCVAPVLHALQSKTPKHRYGVTLPTHVFAFLRRILPSWLLDKLLIRSA